MCCIRAPPNEGGIGKSGGQRGWSWIFKYLQGFGGVQTFPHQQSFPQDILPSGAISIDSVEINPSLLRPLYEFIATPEDSNMLKKIFLDINFQETWSVLS